MPFVPLNLIDAQFQLANLFRCLPAFDELYYFERACETYITALSTGKPLRASQTMATNGAPPTTGTCW